ncbi:helix-turn-helix domain-containing protein [Actinocrinis puniceicyclus]|jgi:excisionase family DNA binding protein|uniref:Helix-turn-helix domain-containing protein n=1 Tax=Actinocrinis puniceicyclus TaxID=977794 RepID=A0A8J7WN56_9ACTN|nr:helix-turn-helix domain-containing protein [Actinocrinis puniceicyclus]MBS2965461.1 helix-turn-helix domain-containing protein [Actinocrinis puniceicyclus]
MPRNAVLTHATRVGPEETDRAFLTALDDDEHPMRLIARTSDGREIELPEALARMLRAAAHDLLDGNTVLALPLETRLTPNEAAELLGISRPFLLELIAAGRIPAEPLPDSRHRLLRLADVLAFQAERERRGAARRAIMQIVEDENLPY